MKNLSNFSNDDLQGILDVELKECLVRILSVYGNPSFGSMSKRDIDLTMFLVLQKLKFIESEPTIYEVMQKLKVTRSKARNLIYEAEIRKLEDENDLDKKLREKIQHPIFGKIGDKISLEIDNPLLIDHLRYRLKKLGAITDGSFHAEIVSMTHEAFSDLYVELLPQEDVNAIYDKFVELGVAPEKGAKPFLKAAMRCVAHAALGKAGEDLMGAAQNIVGDWIQGIHNNIPELQEGIRGTIYERILEA